MTNPKPGANVSAEARALSPWFHNLHLPDQTQTAPDHPLGDFPASKWTVMASHLPEDLNGWSVLDVGCNAGFYSIELAKRGARVMAIDREPHFLKQARWAVEKFDLTKQIELRQMQIYEVAHLREQFDLVLFLGLFYHLRYPLLGLDIVAEKARRLLLFQTLTMPGETICDVADDYPIHERDVMLKPGWPKMAFIEKSLADDPTNWWAPDHACVEAMLRSTGMGKVSRLGHEIYLCQAAPENQNAEKRAVVDELAAALGRKPAT